MGLTLLIDRQRPVYSGFKSTATKVWFERREVILGSLNGFTSPSFGSNRALVVIQQSSTTDRKAS